MLYCDECQLPREECSGDCPGSIEREAHEIEEVNKWEYGTLV